MTISVRKEENLIIKFLLTIILTLLPILANAAEDGTINCTISCTNIIFTAFNPYDATFERANGSISIRCTNSGTSSRSVTYYTGVIGGNSTNYAARVLKNGTNSISYNMYKDSAYTQILGDTSSGTVYITTTITIARGGSRTDNYTIYGKIPVQPLAKPMTYTDVETCGVLWEEELLSKEINQIVL